MAKFWFTGIASCKYTTQLFTRCNSHKPKVCGGKFFVYHTRTLLIRSIKNWTRQAGPTFCRGCTKNLPFMTNKEFVFYDHIWGVAQVLHWCGMDVVRVCLFVCWDKGPWYISEPGIASLVASQLVALILIICVWLLANVVWVLRRCCSGVVQVSRRCCAGVAHILRRCWAGVT